MAAPDLVTHPPLLSIVIVNSDGTEDTLKCLESISRYPPDEPFEVILVDNCSREPCLPIVHDRYPQVRTFSAPERQGFAKNYNLGIRQSCGTYILILNNDTLVHQRALNSLLTALRQNPSYGMVGPQLRSLNGQIQTVCARSLLTPASYIWTQFVTDLSLPTGKLWNRYLQWRLARRPSGPVPCISGACMMMRREAVETVGLLDEDYTFYYEDVEWCHRFQRQGKVVAYVADAQVTHLGDRSLSKVKVWAQKSGYQSAIRYFRQYHGLSPTQMWLLWSVTVVSFLLRGLVFLLIETASGKHTHVRAYLYLWQWIIQQRPGKVSDE